MILSLAALNAAERETSRTEGASSNLARNDAKTSLTKKEAINQLTQGIDGYKKNRVINIVREFSPDLYLDAFVDTVNQLSQGMNADDKVETIQIVEKLSPDRYTDAFVMTVNQLSQGMSDDEKGGVIMAVGRGSPDRYTDAFVMTVNQLSQGMNAQNKIRAIMAVEDVSPDRYTDFIIKVNQLSQGMSGYDKIWLIEAIGKLSPDCYTFLQNFIRLNPRYFRYVPMYEFEESIEPDMTQQQLQDTLEQLHRQYLHQAPPATPKALAFDVHIYANQKVANETGQKQPF
ncbi:MAG: hypothetical protein NEHIOOID_00999 [Holosporales bacterium]